MIPMEIFKYAQLALHENFIYIYIYIPGKYISKELWGFFLASW